MRSQARASIRLLAELIAAADVRGSQGGSPPPTAAGTGYRPGGPAWKRSSRSPVTPSSPWHRTSLITGSPNWEPTVSAAPTTPRLIAALTGPGGWIDCLDMLMAGHGTGSAGTRHR